MSPRTPFRGPESTGPRVVAFGGGHGLAANLTALRRVTDRITAVVGVADDGGSSGRLRAEFGVLPPGDLRMALAALCGDDTWGRTWQRVVQHRFGGEGDLAGHSLGNLLITALWEETQDAVTGLDWVAALLETQGRVLPCSTVPLEIAAQVCGLDAGDPTATQEVRGQVAIATTPGEVLRIALHPAQPPACPDAIDAIAAADLLVFGPGSWFTSVLPHLLIPDQLAAIHASRARRVVVLNLDPRNDVEMSGAAIDRHLALLAETAPGLRIDAVIADPAHVEDPRALRERCAALGARLELATVSYGPVRPGVHDPGRLAVAYGSLLAAWQDDASWR